MRGGHGGFGIERGGGVPHLITGHRTVYQEFPTHLRVYAVILQDLNHGRNQLLNREKISGFDHQASFYPLGFSEVFQVLNFEVY